MPNLTSLKLNESTIPSIRDLGVALSNLRVLWLRRCRLQELSGIAAMPLLEELYVPFNDITDLSPLCYNDSLQVLDVEGNMIEELDEFQGLQTCSNLRELTVASNPFCRTEEFSLCGIKEFLPQLEMLDDTPVSMLDHSSADSTSQCGSAAGSPGTAAAVAEAAALTGLTDDEEQFRQELRDIRSSSEGGVQEKSVDEEIPIAPSAGLLALRERSRLAAAAGGEAPSRRLDGGVAELRKEATTTGAEKVLGEQQHQQQQQKQGSVATGTERLLRSLRGELRRGSEERERLQLALSNAMEELAAARAELQWTRAQAEERILAEPLAAAHALQATAGVRVRIRPRDELDASPRNKYTWDETNDRYCGREGMLDEVCERDGDGRVDFGGGDTQWFQLSALVAA